MKKLAITGASSFIGQHLVNSLGNLNEYQIRVLVHRNRNVDAFNKSNVVTVEGNLMKAESLERLIETNATVISLAYLKDGSKEENLEAICNLAEVCVKAKIDRLIHCSTAAVYGSANNRGIEESTTCNPQNEYETTKLAVEKILLEKYSRLFEIVILRPTSVFGPGGKNLVKLAKALTDGNRVLNYLKSSVFYFRKLHLVNIDNVIGSIYFLIKTEQKMEREIFIISDDECRDNNYRDVEKYLIKRFGIKDYPLPPIPMPLIVLDWLLRAFRKASLNPKQIYDCQKLLKTGFKKPIFFTDGLAKFADWYENEFLMNRSGL